MIPEMSMTDNIARINKHLKERLAADKTHGGTWPWVKVTVDTRVALVYIKFREVEDSTMCFNLLDGYCYDG